MLHNNSVNKILFCLAFLGIFSGCPSRSRLPMDPAETRWRELESEFNDETRRWLSRDQTSLSIPTPSRILSLWGENTHKSRPAQYTFVLGCEAAQSMYSTQFRIWHSEDVPVVGPCENCTERMDLVQLGVDTRTGVISYVLARSHYFEIEHPESMTGDLPGISLELKLNREGKLFFKYRDLSSGRLTEEIYWKCNRSDFSRWSDASPE